MGELLQYKKKCKFLGVTLDNKMSLKDHIEENHNIQEKNPKEKEITSAKQGSKSTAKFAFYKYVPSR